MSLTEVDQLQSALLQRAEALAREYRTEGQMIAARISQESQARLRQHEAQAVEQARLEAERQYQRRMQTEAMRLQAEWDRARWREMQAVLEELTVRFQRCVASPDYPPLLRAWLREAVRALPGDELEARANARDQTLLAQEVAALNAEQPVQLRLAAEPISTLGGCAVYAAGGRIRVDNSFEGRLARFREELERLTLAQLFGDAHG